MQVSQLSIEDCERLKTFFICYSDWFHPATCADPGEQPLGLVMRVGSDFIAESTEALPRAIHAAMEMSARWTPEQVAEADAWLAAAGTFTLSEVRRRFSKRYLRILRRGAIRLEAEYFLVKGILDYGAVEPGSSESTQLGVMLEAFEARLVATLAPVPVENAPNSETPECEGSTLTGDLGTHRSS